MKQYLCCVKTKNFVKEISERFREIKDFDKREDFEKIIRGIFHFANLPSQEVYVFGRIENIGFNEKALVALIGNESYIERFYENKQVYKKILEPLLCANPFEDIFTYKFLNYLQKDGLYSISHILTDVEINDIAFNNFKNAVSMSKNFNKELWWIFLRCESRRKVSIGYSSQISYKKDERAVELLDKFIWETGVDSFIFFAIDQNHSEERFILKNVITTLYENNEAFVTALKQYNGVSEYKKEFLAFYEALNTDEYKERGVPTNFFKVIPVNYTRFN
jgi:hypothetical protein